MPTKTSYCSRGATRRTIALVAAAVALAVAAGATSNVPAASSRSATRVWTIRYNAHNGANRVAYVILPAWYGPANNPPLPVVISPHGRGATGRSNAKFFGNLPAVGGFAVISPDGMGRRLGYYSYGFPGQIDDLAKMPEFALRALPWLRIDRSRIYALGSSMGGQETALLVARHPRLLAGAAAMDSVTDLARRYDQLPSLPCDRRCLARWGQPFGVNLQSAMRREVGATPEQDRRAYAARSALSQSAAIARSGVPLQIWWSRNDRIVFDQKHQSEALVRAVQKLNPCAPVSSFEGRWRHSTEMRANSLLPIALAHFGLLPRPFKPLPSSVRHHAAPVCGV